jgi:hypothetical protein
VGGGSELDMVRVRTLYRDSVLCWATGLQCCRPWWASSNLKHDLNPGTRGQGKIPAYVPVLVWVGYKCHS